MTNDKNKKVDPEHECSSFEFLGDGCSEAQSGLLFWWGRNSGKSLPEKWA